MYFNENEKVKAILEMTKKDFHRKIIKNVVKTSEFTKVINFGIDSLSEKEANKLVDILEKNGLKNLSGNDLLPVVHAIVNRAASYR